MANRAGGARVKVTVAVPFPVYPPVGGGQRRVFHIYQHVARECDVEVVSLGEADSDFFEAEIAAGLTELRIPKSVRHQEEEARLARAVGGIPVGDIGVSLLVEQTPEFVEELARSMSEADLVVASHPYCLPAIEKTLGGKPLVYEAHNVEYVVKKGALGQSGGVGADLIEIVRRIEARACERSGLILCCSEKDREELQQLYGVDPGRVAIAPNGVDVEGVRFAGPPVRERAKAEFGLTGEAIVLFVGSWHPPNLEAAEAIFGMARALPGVKFLLAGSQCLPLAHRTLPENVGLLGVVDDETLGVVLTLADVALNPMRGGSGTNLKLATYFAAGVPVITTSLGARGYELVDGQHVVICPLEDFPEWIREVLGNRVLAQEIARRARRVVEERYDWRTIASGVTRALLRVLGRRAGTAAMVEGLIERVSTEMSELGIPEDEVLVRTVAEAMVEAGSLDGGSATGAGISGDRDTVGEGGQVTEAAYETAAASTGDMERDWDRRARLDARFFIECSHYRTEEEFVASGEDVLRSIILRDITLDARAAVLEIGCGVGRLLGPLASLVREVHGVDVSGEMVARGRDRLRACRNVHLHRSSGSDFAILPDRYFDFCFSFITFQHVPRKEIVYSYLREVARVLRPGGIFRFQVDGRPGKASRDYAGTWEGVAFSEDEIVEELRRCKLGILDMWGHRTQYLLVTAEREKEARAPATDLVRFSKKRWREGAVRAFVERLGVVPIEAWTARLVEDRSAVRDIVEAFVRENVRLPVGDYVSGVYRQVLGREADREGFEHYSGGLVSGVLARDEFVYGLIASSEFDELMVGGEAAPVP